MDKYSNLIAISFLSACAIAILAKPQPQASTNCIKFTPQLLKNISKYMGIWYEYETYTLDHALKKFCKLNEFDLGYVQEFKSGHIRFHLNVGKDEYISVNATVLGNHIIDFRMSSKITDANATVYSIITANPDQFMVMYSCVKGNPVFQIQTRNPFISQSLLNATYELLKHKILSYKFVKEYCPKNS